MGKRFILAQLTQRMLEKTFASIKICEFLAICFENRERTSFRKIGDRPPFMQKVYFSEWQIKFLF